MRAAAMIGVAAVLCVGCGSGALDAQSQPSVAGEWSYSWVARSAPDPVQTLHGAMAIAALPDGTLSGTLAQPVEIADDGAEGWPWLLTGVQNGSGVALTAENDTKSPWWFALALDGDEIAGPEWAGPDRVDMHALFTATRN